MDARPALKGFVAAACGIVALLFVDAATGRVLTQTDILLQYSPWFEHAPAAPAATNGRQPGNPLLSDVPTFVYPSLALTRTSLRALKLPVWNPYIYGGQPFLASYQTGLLSPSVVLSVLLPPADSLLAHAVTRLLIGGIGMFLFLRRLGLTTAAVWFGALSFLLNPFTVVWLQHPPSAVSCWLPWLLWSVERNRQDGGPGNVALLAVTTALTLLAGHPETAFKVLLMTGAYSLGMCLAGTNRVRWRTDCTMLLGRLLPAVVLGACLAAAQIVPFLEYMDESGIAAMRRTFRVSPFVIPAQASLTAFVPEALGNPARGETLVVRNAAGAQANYLEQQTYPGNVAWILAGVALATRGRRQWRVWVLASTAGLSAALVYGAPVVSRAFALIPMAGLSAPARFGLLTSFSVMTLGAIGLSAMGEHRRGAMRGALAALAVMAVIVAAVLWWQWPLFRHSGFFFEVRRAVLWSSGIASVACGLVVGWAVGWWPRRVAVVLLAILTVGDLFSLAFRFHPMLPRADVFPALPSIERIKEDPTVFRVAGFGLSLPPNTAMVYGLADPRGYDGVAPRHFTDLLGRAFGPAMLHHVDRGDALPVLDLLNVKYLIANDDVSPPVPSWSVVATDAGKVYRNDGVFPRAWLVDRVTVRDDASTLDWIVAGTSDLRHEAPVPEAFAAGTGPEPADAGGVGEVTLRRYEPTQVVLTTHASGRRLLVLADAWYPGWKAYVDGQAVPIVRAYHALRAVPVPGGDRIVRFSYEPASLTIGTMVSAAAVLVLGALLVITRKRG